MRGRARRCAHAPWVGASNVDARFPSEMHDHGVEQLHAKHASVGSICVTRGVDSPELRLQHGKVRS
jgi:hypothetical protein